MQTCAQDDLTHYAYLELFGQIASMKFYDSLRTRQQLGYSVDGYTSRAAGKRLGYVFQVLS